MSGSLVDRALSALGDKVRVRLREQMYEKGSTYSVDDLRAFFDGYQQPLFEKGIHLTNTQLSNWRIDNLPTGDLARQHNILTSQWAGASPADSLTMAMGVSASLVDDLRRISNDLLDEVRELKSDPDKGREYVKIITVLKSTTDTIQGMLRVQIQAAEAHHKNQQVISDRTLYIGGANRFREILEEMAEKTGNDNTSSLLYKFVAACYAQFEAEFDLSQ